MTTDTTERGLERLICTALTGHPCDPGVAAGDAMRVRPAVYGAGWIGGDPNANDREYRARLIADVVTGKLDADDDRHHDVDMEGSS